jgi:hypothetical protein
LVDHLQTLAAAERAAGPVHHAMETKMDDDSTETPLGVTLISLDKPEEIASWCKSFNCTEIELRRAVLAIGPGAERVRGYIATHR